MKVSNMQSSNGNSVANQFVVSAVTTILNGRHETGNMFQSYDSNIAFKTYDRKIYLDENYWNYSTTTGKYRNQFLGECIADTRKKIKSGIYKLVNLN